MARHLPHVLAVLLAAAALGYGFTGYPLLEPDEGRNAEVAREMAAGNDYVLPRLNGLPYIDKPVLYFAAGAVVMELLGPTELAARLPSLVFTLLTLVVLVWFARRRIGPEGAWIAGIAGAAAPFTIAYARTVIFDSALTLWVVVAIIAFYEAVEAEVAPATAQPPNRPPAGGRGWGWAVLAWIAIGLGLLTKGPVALVLPLLVALPYAGWRRRWRAVLEPLGLLAMLAIVLPWTFAVSRAVPGFLQYVLVVETAQRLATDALGRTEAWWYFAPILLGAALPWSVVALAGTVRALRRRPLAFDPRAVWLGLWVIVPLVFFSLSQSKRPQYILPLVPPLALSVALLWQGAARRTPGARTAAAVLLLLGAVLVAGATRLPELVRASAEVRAATPGAARMLGAVAVAAGAFTWALCARQAWVLAALALPAAAIPIAGGSLLSAIGADRSSRALAQAVAPWLEPHTEVVAVGTFPLSLPFYLRRPLTVATADARELTSNYIARHQAELRRVPGSPLRPAEWWEEALALCGRPRLFVVPVEAAAARARLEEAVPLRATARKVAVYGPCGAAGYAYSP
ncbi:MAG: glycosyltransferase family 39 protein [Gemmatimonadota bacterium]|nr:glycosyltransferase family 39 protein [Gemmatimonadota bacterium]